MSEYGVFPGLYFPVFSTNTGKYGPEKAPYLDTFHAVSVISSLNEKKKCRFPYRYEDVFSESPFVGWKTSFSRPVLKEVLGQEMCLHVNLKVDLLRRKYN